MRITTAQIAWGYAFILLLVNGENIRTYVSNGEKLKAEQSIPSGSSPLVETEDLAEWTTLGLCREFD